MFFIILIIGLISAYINGIHDGGNVVATTIASRIETPVKAVVIAGIANFSGAILLGTTVAVTISEDIINKDFLLNEDKDIILLLIISAFSGSFIWNILTWITRMPSSSSHSLIGSMIGSGIGAAGAGYIMWNSIFFKVIVAMLVSPLIGFIMGFLIWKLHIRLLKNATMIWNKRIIFLHKLSSFILSFSYGSNDAQKVMGLIAIGLASYSGNDIEIPLWLMIGCAAALSLGTMTGGHNMIKTVGMDICKINIDNSFVSQIATISVVATANFTGIPISTTQVITSSVMGAGTGNTPRSVNWKIIYKIMIAWITTLPASGLMGYITFFILKTLFL